MNAHHAVLQAGRLPSAASRGHQRRGVVLVCALVCLSVTTALLIATIQQSLAARRQGRMQWQLRQTQYLCDAGVRRAVTQLNADGAYSGETWQPSEALPAFRSVVVEINVMPLEEEPSRRQVSVLARLSRGESEALGTQRSLKFIHALTAQAEPQNLE